MIFYAKLGANKNKVKLKIHAAKFHLKKLKTTKIMKLNNNNYNNKEYKSLKIILMILLTREFPKIF